MLAEVVEEEFKLIILLVPACIICCEQCDLRIDESKSLPWSSGSLPIGTTKLTLDRAERVACGWILYFVLHDAAGNLSLLLRVAIHLQYLRLKSILYLFWIDRQIQYFKL